MSYTAQERESLLGSLFYIQSKVGCRASEILNIADWIVDKQLGTITYCAIKTRRFVTIYMSSLDLGVIKSSAEQIEIQGRVTYYEYSKFIQKTEPDRINYIDKKRVTTHLPRHLYIKELKRIGYTKQAIADILQVSKSTIEYYLKSNIS